MNSYQQWQRLNVQNPSKVVTVKQNHGNGMLTVTTGQGNEIDAYGDLAVDDMCLIDAVTKQVKRKIPKVTTYNVTIT